MSEPRTLLDLFSIWRQSSPAPCLVDARGGGERTLDAREVTRRVAGLAMGLERLGVVAGDRVAILSSNRPEWHITDFAVLSLGAADVPLYSTLGAAQVGPLLKDSGAKVAVVENGEQLAKVLESRPHCPALEHVLLLDGDGIDGVRRLDEVTVGVSDADAAAWLEERRQHVGPGDLATLIYTSGTTGEPKGAMLTHDNFVFNATSSSSLMPWPEGGEVALSFLPLSHVLERLVDYIYYLKGISVSYCGVLEIAEAFRRVRPNLFTAVPRVYEKIYDRIFEEVAHAPRLKRALFRRAVNAAIEELRTGRRGALHGLWDTLVFSKIRSAFGGRVRFTISGGAPLPVFVGELFHAVGVLVLEGYGLTETSPVIAVNTVTRHKLGTVGVVIPGVEVRIASDGEVLTRGRHVMRGYWAKPEETAAAIDGDQWFATGDIGELTDEGYLKITDRKKDILVTAGGKNVAPQPIENELKKSPFVEVAVLLGDRKPYIAALVVPAFEELERWAKQRGIAVSSREDLVRRPEVLALYQGVVDDVNAHLARFETVKKFSLLSVPLTMEGGELTPTLKVKRRVVEKRYSKAIDALYPEVPVS